MLGFTDVSGLQKELLDKIVPRTQTHLLLFPEVERHHAHLSRFLFTKAEGCGDELSSTSWGP